MNTYKNKTLAALLASVGGTLGMHRFYLQGSQDKWAWLHLMSLPVSALVYYLSRDLHPFFTALPVILSMLAGFLTCLIIGTTSDEKWDASYNQNSLKKSATSWPIAVILVLTLGIGASALIAVIARTFDLLFTGGLYG
jgi:TM2 domain-containing membrane protein YozV